MNARLPLRAIPVSLDSLPPITGCEMRFQTTVEGVTLDTLILYDDDFGIEVSAIWHWGVNIAPLLDPSIDEAILNAYEEHRKQLREDIAIERKYG